ncbi:hypothetical protein, partial [Chromobacterium piscinae]|uniref:hypothetical protein n=1 Tax=Chromobacterium piscinae TaxID=686831 RepID=UPI003260B029
MALGVGDADAGGLAEQGLEFDGAVGGQAGKLITIGLGHALFAIQALRQQLLGGDGSAAQLQGEQALVLVEGGGEGGK